MRLQGVLTHLQIYLVTWLPLRSACGSVLLLLQNMGTMQVLPLLGKHLNTYLPLLLVVHCLLIWLNLWDRLAGACVSSKYKFNK
jgi:hypothetical protein